MSDKEITCPVCNKTFKPEDAQIICSNCFACKGCERYYCPYCNEAVIIDPVKPMFEDKNESSEDK